MRVIGLTGNIGCGKSTVAGMLRRHGVATIDADEVTRELRETDADMRGAILARFGTLDPGDLARRVFADAGELSALEALVHPVVRRAVLTKLAALERAGTGVVALEAIKLLESPLRDRCDAIWVVACDERDAIARLVADRGWSEADARARLATQSPQAEKLAAADVVIDGSAPMAETERQVVEALRGLEQTPTH